MSPSFAARVSELRGSATGKAAAGQAAAGEARNNADDVIDLAVGCPDWAPPEEALAAARDVLRGRVAYGLPGGDPSLRSLLCSRAHVPSGTRGLDSIVTSGGKEALFLGLGAVVSPGDRVAVLAPYWPSFLEQVRAWGGIPVIVPAGDDGLPDRARLQEVMPWVKAVIINTPCNPNGRVWSQDRIEALGRWAETHDTWVILDAVYAALGPPGTEVLPSEAMGPLAGRMLAVDSASKRFALPGLRVGWATGPAAWVDGMRRLQDASSTHPSTVGQAALRGALAAERGWMPSVRRTLEERRSAFRAAAQAAGFPAEAPPQAGLFGLLRLPPRVDDQRLAEDLAHHDGVRVLAGRAFGAPGTLRVALIVDPAKITVAIGRIQGAIERALE